MGMPKGITTSERPDGSKELEARGTGRIITLDDLLDAAEVNLREWYVSHWKANAWETHFKLSDDHIDRRTNYQVKANLAPNKPIIEFDALMKEMVEAMNAHSPNYREVTRDPIHIDDEAHVLVVDLFDLHVSMLAWDEETGEASYDSKIAERMVMEAVEKIIYRSKNYPITKIVFPMGNDLLHADRTIGGSGGATNAGTPQDVDTRHLKSYRTAMHIIVQVIDLLRLLAPVEVVVVPGNHDKERVQYLGETVSAWYRRDPEVTVNNAANLRKYVQFGTTLLGFTHGSEEKLDKLPLLMAAEQPAAWARAEHKTFHTGHLHVRKTGLTWTTDTFQGVEVRIIPSLVPPDAWHASKGFVGGGRSAEAHIYGAESGYAGTVAYSLPRRTAVENHQLIVLETR